MYETVHHAFHLPRPKLLNDKKVNTELLVYLQGDLCMILLMYSGLMIEIRVHIREVLFHW